MGVVIDEFIAEVEPASGNNQQPADEIEDQTDTAAIGAQELYEKLQLLKERQLRLKAD